MGWRLWHRQQFLSTLSLRRATISVRENNKRTRNFYPRSPCGERLQLVLYTCVALAISIHALLAESDICVLWTVANLLLFLSTLSLRRATVDANGERSIAVFLSTLSLRRATMVQPTHHARAGNFYPRSPCGERQQLGRRKPEHEAISIHALLAESDSNLASTIVGIENFYPRSPCGERLHYDNYNLHCVEISIHALLAESDNKILLLKRLRPIFLSTLSLRRATSSFCFLWC